MADWSSTKNKDDESLLFIYFKLIYSQNLGHIDTH